MIATLVVLAMATGGGDQTPATCDGRPASFHTKRAHAVLRNVYEDHLNLPRTELVPKAQKHKACLRLPKLRRQIEVFRDERKDAWYVNVTPYEGAGQRWAIPYYIVRCESGGGVYPNLYGLLEGWDEWNYGLVQTSSAAAAPKLHQDMAAHRGWTFHGGAPWSCA